MRNESGVSGLAAAVEKFETSDHLERMLENTQSIAGDEIIGGQHDRAAARQARMIEIEDAALDLRRDEIVGVASRQQYCEILRRRRHQRILKIDNSDAVAVLEVQIVAVVIAM